MSDRRGVSTVVDVTLCVLLVGAAAAVLVGAGVPADRPAPVADARAAAGIVTASTATVPYRVHGETRTANGTLAHLLVAAAARDARARPGDGVRAFHVGVRRVVRRALDAVPGPMQAVARWRPPSGGRVTVGEDPPPGAQVDAAVVRVPFASENARVVVRTWSP